MPTLNSMVNVISEDDSDYLAKTTIIYGKTYFNGNNSGTLISITDSIGEINNLYVQLGYSVSLTITLDEKFISFFSPSDSNINIFFSIPSLKNIYLPDTVNVFTTYIDPDNGSITSIDINKIKAYGIRYNSANNLNDSSIFFGNLKFKKNCEISINNATSFSRNVSYGFMITSKDN